MVLTFHIESEICIRFSVSVLDIAFVETSVIKVGVTEFKLTEIDIVFLSLDDFLDSRRFCNGFPFLRPRNRRLLSRFDETFHDNEFAISLRSDPWLLNKYRWFSLDRFSRFDVQVQVRNQFPVTVFYYALVSSSFSFGWILSRTTWEKTEEFLTQRLRHRGVKRLQNKKTRRQHDSRWVRVSRSIRLSFLRRCCS